MFDVDYKKKIWLLNCEKLMGIIRKYCIVILFLYFVVRILIDVKFGEKFSSLMKYLVFLCKLLVLIDIILYFNREFFIKYLIFFMLKNIV